MANLTGLASKIKGDLITPDHPEYASAISRWAKNAERNAKVVVFVKDAEDVAAAIAYAKEQNLLLAIRGGGHNAAGASSAADGLVVDLSRYVNTVRIDAEAKLGYVGGGALWRDVDKEAIKHGLATVGGTVNHTGVGGLTLGGGYGWLSGRHGLTIDNLRQATVVTADGSILTANENENSDLFFGIRGGGCNFGVVTEFVLQLHPQRPRVFAGFVVYTPDKVEKVLEVTKQWWTNVGEDEAMLHVVTTNPAGQPCLVVYFFYNGSEAEGRTNFKAFLDIGPVLDTAKEIPYEELNALQNPGVDHGKCYYLKGVNQKALKYETTVGLMNKCAEIAKEGKVQAALIHEYLPSTKINSVPVSATAFRRQVTPNILTSLSWPGDHPERTEEARKIANELIDIVHEGQQDLPESEKVGYTNYETDVLPHSTMTHGDATPDKAQLAFASNYPKLQSIKKKYDPENVFNRWFPITPA